MNAKKVLVTGIGGNVAQGVVRNIRKSFENIFIVGTNVNQFSAGNHLVDKFYKLPFAYDANYIPEIKKLIESENIQLIIPTTDFESFVLSSRDDLNTKLASSDHSAHKVYIDKYESYLHHKANNIAFAESYLVSNYKDSFDSYIVKPRKGRGSRGIHINPPNLHEFDDEYLVQEYCEGKEITTAFYVTQNGELHGLITLERQLVNGTTINCRVIDTYDSKLEEIILAMIESVKVRGSVNIQSIVDKNNKITPFEINCRISGTNSIRSNFGFKDVEYTIQEYLLSQKPEKIEIKKGIATRLLMDVIYLGDMDYSNLEDRNSKHYIY